VNYPVLNSFSSVQKTKYFLEPKVDKPEKSSAIPSDQSYSAPGFCVSS